MFGCSSLAIDPRFGLEAPAECPVVQEFGGQDLERDGPIQPGVVCFVDGAHSAAAEQAADDELPERRRLRAACRNASLVGVGAGRWSVSATANRHAAHSPPADDSAVRAAPQVSHAGSVIARSRLCGSPRASVRTGPGTRPLSIRRITSPNTCCCIRLLRRLLPRTVTVIRRSLEWTPKAPSTMV